MSYTPTTWTTGDTITASALNKIEQGIADGGGGSGAMIVNVTVVNNVYTMDKTYAEIYNAFKSGTPCFAKRIESTDDPIDNQYNFANDFEPITTMYKYDTVYRLYTSANIHTYTSGVHVGLPATRVFQVSTSEDYPTYYRGVSVNPSYIQISSYYE